MLSVIMQSIIMLSVSMLSVLMLCVIMLNVVAPAKVFFPGRPFQPSPMFGGKAAAYLMIEARFRCFTLG